jgi:hypothetical protein
LSEHGSGFLFGPGGEREPSDRPGDGDDGENEHNNDGAAAHGADSELEAGESAC